MIAREARSAARPRPPRRASPTTATTAPCDRQHAEARGRSVGGGRLRGQRARSRRSPPACRRPTTRLRTRNAVAVLAPASRRSACPRRARRCAARCGRRAAGPTARRGRRSPCCGLRHHRRAPPRRMHPRAAGPHTTSAIDELRSGRLTSQVTKKRPNVTAAAARQTRGRARLARERERRVEIELARVAAEALRHERRRRVAERARRPPGSRPSDRPRRKPGACRRRRSRWCRRRCRRRRPAPRIRPSPVKSLLPSAPQVIATPPTPRARIASAASASVAAPVIASAWSSFGRNQSTCSQIAAEVVEHLGPAVGEHVDRRDGPGRASHARGSRREIGADDLGRAEVEEAGAPRSRLPGHVARS